MPDKPLTIQIPEPDRNGDCSSACPLRSAEYEQDGETGFGGTLIQTNCSGDLERSGSKVPFIRPGPKCPQYQGG